MSRFAPWSWPRVLVEAISSTKRMSASGSSHSTYDRRFSRYGVPNTANTSGATDLLTGTPNSSRPM